MTIAVAIAAAACGRSDAGEPSTVDELRASALADSAAGDSAALATLPPALQEVLRIEPYLTDAFLSATPGAECRVLETALPEALRAERRRVRVRLPDSSAVVVYVRVPSAGVGLERVEIVRRPLHGEQLGFIWDAGDDRTTEVRWPTDLHGRTEAAPQPRGGPVPRAVRALGRRVLALRCDGDSPAARPRFETDVDSIPSLTSE